MSRCRIFIILFLACCNATATFCQTRRIDSLRMAVLVNSAGLQKKQAVLELCSMHASMPTDSSLKYINLGKSLTEFPQDDYFRIQNYYCMYLIKEGATDQAIHLLDSIHHLADAHKISTAVTLDILNNKCVAYIRTNKLKEANIQAFDILQLAERNNDTLNILRAYNMLGWSNLEAEKYAEAVMYLLKGVNFSRNEYWIRQVLFLYSNLASAYNNLGKFDSAFYFVNKALLNARQIESLSVQTNALNIRADIYINQKNSRAAEQDLLEALQIRKKIGDDFFVMADLAQLSLFYASINEPRKGIDAGHEAIATGAHLNNIPKMIFTYNALSENYKIAGMLKEYAGTLNKIIELKDTLYKNNSENVIARLQADYELQKKENIILQQENKIQRNTFIIISGSIAFILILILGNLLYRSYILKQNEKMQTIVNEQKRIAEEQVHTARELERKRIAADLHDNLGSYAAAISSNMHYLKVQIDASQHEMVRQLEENAQSIVTQLSDTIWILKNERLKLTDLADRFKAWMQRWMKNYQGIRYYYDEQIETDPEFSPEKVLHIFLIMKECLTNAVKHANCKNIKVSIIYTHQLWIIIADDGKGLNGSLFKGNGISNVKQRAQMSNLDVRWEPSEPQGTAVILSGFTTN